MDGGAKVGQVNFVPMIAPTYATPHECRRRVCRLIHARSESTCGESRTGQVNEWGRLGLRRAAPSSGELSCTEPSSANTESIPRPAGNPIILFGGRERGLINERLKQTLRRR